jgi:hypothetical protein
MKSVLLKKSKTQQRRLVEKKLIEIALRIAKKGEGCLFILGMPEYETLIEQKITGINIFDQVKLVEGLAKIDGACIITEKGILIAYGALIKNTKAFANYGTRHAAAYTSSKKGVSILASEEERKVKIFKNGKLVMQLDALEKGIENRAADAVGLLEAVGFGALGTIGTTLFVPAVGISLLPGILVFGGSYYALKSLLKMIKR